MQRVLRGVHHFQKENFRSLHKLFEELAERQNPDTLFVTCSDSRIDPNLLTRSKPGDLFILRNAGNIVPTHGSFQGGEAATIEYAVSALQVKDIIICGHSNCGAMMGLLEPERVAKLPAVSSWLNHAETTRRIVMDNYADLKQEDLLAITIKENVLVQLENLRTLPSVASRLVRGDLRVHGWVYEIETGEVLAFDVEQGQFVAIAEYHYPESETAARRRTSYLI